MIKFPDYGNALRGGTNLFPEYFVPQEILVGSNEKENISSSERSLKKKKKLEQLKRKLIFDADKFMAIESRRIQFEHRTP